MVSAFSSPGKALIAGGYLVLDPEYDSYVTALSARMHAVVESKKNDSVHSISMSSPQFDGFWKYACYPEVEEVNGNKNPFLDAAVDAVLSYVGKSAAFDINITIYSDPGFHTQHNTTVKSSTNGHKAFLYHKQSITQTPKTGLGSSACLTSVVTAAILSELKPEALKEKHILHNLCQLAHCKAQKKIGSGFDVATAVYGSIQYRRFDPQLIQPYLEGDTSNLVELVESNWSFTHEPCNLPPFVRLLMGDIAGGSETPKLVSTVLNWRKQNPERSAKLYLDLNGSNIRLIKSLKSLHEFYETDKSTYIAAIEYFKTRSLESVSHNDSYEPFFNLIDAIKDIRKYLKQLTELSGADIEPESQTKLLDDCSSLPGCLGGVVPGAGGYDAISLLVVDDSIGEIVSASKIDKRFEHVTWLNLEEQSSGLVEEDPADYVGF